MNRRKYGLFKRKEAINLVKYYYGFTTKEALQYLKSLDGKYSILNIMYDGIKQDAHNTFYECNRE
jgi:hypothetical protein